jgi:hypothetical protein
MSNALVPVDAQIDEWRRSGAYRANVVRFSMIESMHRRAAMHGGEARRIIDEKLLRLVDDYARYLEDFRSTPEECGAQSTQSALSELTLSESSIHSMPDALDYFNAVWRRLSTEKQLRHSLQQVPGNAGPLNSSSLVHRSLSLMHALSPGYLQHFLSYVDTLSRIEQIKGLIPAEKETSRSAHANRKPKVKPPKP